jgi:hypothetical protein
MSAAAFILPRAADLAVHGTAAAARRLAGLGQPAGAGGQAPARRRPPGAELRHRDRPVSGCARQRAAHAGQLAAGRRSAPLAGLVCRGAGFPEQFRHPCHLRRHRVRCCSTPACPSAPRCPRCRCRRAASAAPLVLETGKPQVGDIVFGPVANQPLVAIVVPGLRDGKVAHLMVTTIEARQLQQRLDRWRCRPAGLWRWSMAPVPASPGARRMDSTPAGRGGRSSLRGRSEAVGMVGGARDSAPSHRAAQKSAAILAAAIVLATLLGRLGGTLASRRIAQGVKSLSTGRARSCARHHRVHCGARPDRCGQGGGKSPAMNVSPLARSRTAAAGPD